MQTVADDADGGKQPTRRYDASKRRAQAAEARRRIVDAAADLFAAQGYAATTLGQIAERAGVTAKLVVANGPKRGLLLAAFEQRFAGVEGAGPDEARRSAEQILADPEPTRVVERLADFVLDGQERGIGMWRAFSAAADQDPEVHQAYLVVAEGRRVTTRLGLDLLDDLGLRRPGDRDRQTALLALLMGFDPYQLMVLDWGWSRDELRSWTVEQLSRSIVAVPE